MKEIIEIHTLIGQYSTSSYSLFMTLAIFFTIVCSLLLVIRDGTEIRRGLSAILVMPLFVLIGSRLLYVLTHRNYYLKNPSQIWEMEMAGFSLMGGLILATIGCVVYSRIVGIDFWRFADLLTPGLGIGIVFLRIGCFLNGCCFGVKTDVFWAVHFPYNSLAHKYYLGKISEKGIFSLSSMMRSPGIHPTQLYEAIGTMCATIIAVFLIKKKSMSGIPALTAAFVFVSVRFVNHFLRAPIGMDENPGWFYPVIYIIILVIITLRIRTLVLRKKNCFDCTRDEARRWELE